MSMKLEASGIPRCVGKKFGSGWSFFH